MSLTIEFGYWLIPALATFAAFALPAFVNRNEPASYGMDIGGVLVFAASVIFSLLAWLVWAFAVLWLS